MSARFLVRFDDICPTMNWETWAAVESALTEFGVQPILAVVPDNQDPELRVDKPREDFWDRVAGWVERGWSIGLHGYQHLYVTRQAGVIGLNPRSEFAGLPARAQEFKLRDALQILRSHRIVPDVWVAPAHSFDAATLAVLGRLGLKTISDGFYLHPHVDRDGFTWVPQQLWRFRSLPFGVWTVCCHHNHWSSEDVSKFRRDLERFKDKIITLEEARMIASRQRALWLDRLAAPLMLAGVRIKNRRS